jgi:formylglycine-generating enzyme required for sulfatase activity
MVYVPAGEFLMGSTDDDPDLRTAETPQHAVYLDAFWIDRTEVTNAQYHKCIEAEACAPRGTCDASRFDDPSQPAVCVSWDEAQAYSRSALHTPMGPDSGEYRVLRGGSFANGKKLLRCASRQRLIPDEGAFDGGLRVVVPGP